MLLRGFYLTAICLSLTGCSYVYEVAAVVREGQLIFTADETCITGIEVRAEEYETADADLGDDLGRVGNGTFWYQHVKFADPCKNSFPLAYGVALDGEIIASLGVVAAKPLHREVIFTVKPYTGSTGVGDGRFIIHTDGTVENLN